MKVLAFAPVAVIALALAALLGTNGSATAEPSEAQIAAVKSNCRSDFMSNCWGVPRGGKEAMQCLKQHLAKLSPACQQAVNAIVPPASPSAVVAKPESAPAPSVPAAEPAAAAAPETAPPAVSAEPAPPTAATTESAPAEPAPAPKAAAETVAKPAAPAEAKAAPQETPKASGEESPTKTKSAATAAAPAEANETLIIGFIPPRKKLMVLKNCRQDLDTYCPDVSYGEGRQLQCLFSNKAALTPDCQGALAKLTQ